MRRGIRIVLTGGTAAKAGTIAAGSAVRDRKEFLIVRLDKLRTAAADDDQVTGDVLTNCIAIEAQDN
jgi:hypothetical protein